MHTCSECGAASKRPTINCSSHFAGLLALDHSRTEPWGSRDAPAFAAFTLQHPVQLPRDVIERAWILLFKVYEQGDDYTRATDALRGAGRQNPQWDLPSMPTASPGPHFSVTISNLGSFAPGEYPEKLDPWCRAAVAAWDLRSVQKKLATEN